LSSTYAIVLLFQKYGTSYFLIISFYAVS